MLVGLGDHAVQDLAGAVPILAAAGAALVMSECTLHTGLPKTTSSIRSNLYFNYVHAYYNVMMREPKNCHHFYFPSDVRARFTESQRNLTRWMDFTKWDY